MGWETEMDVGGADEYHGIYKTETDMAILFLPGDWEPDEEGIWLPKSRISYDDSVQYERGDAIVIEIPDWLAEDKEII